MSNDLLMTYEDEIITLTNTPLCLGYIFQILHIPKNKKTITPR